MLVTSLLLPLIISFSVCIKCESQGRPYTPTWESLDSRPLPAWYDDAKIGIFIHFGVYSVPSFVSEWFWCYWKCPGRVRPDVVKFMQMNYPPSFTYQDFAKELTLEFFNATEWVGLFQKAGAKYGVLTSKHHEGYTLWPSKYSYSWNSMDVGPKRDVVGEFASAIRSFSGMHLGLYHSLFEWFNPLYLQDKANNFTTRHYPESKGVSGLVELVNTYKPDLIWSDGDPGPVEYWRSREFLAWLYNESPVKDNVVVNDRWGTGTSCVHGGYLNCADRYDPDQNQTRKWENAMTLDTHSWGYRRNAKLEDYVSIKQLLTLMAKTISNGGNLLVDVGPTKEGTIPLIMQDILLKMGDWLSANGEAIYATKKWSGAWNDTITPDVYYTASKVQDKIYAIFLNWPQDDTIVLGSVDSTMVLDVSLLGYNGNLGVEGTAKVSGTKVILPSLSQVQNLLYAWTLKVVLRPAAKMLNLASVDIVGDGGDGGGHDV